MDSALRALLKGFYNGKKVPGFFAIIDADILAQHGGLIAAEFLDLKPPRVRYESQGEYLVCEYYRMNDKYHDAKHEKGDVFLKMRLSQ